MLTSEANEKMCRVSAGTPMGDALRHYWIPAARTEDLVSDGDPVIADLLGERLVAFRNSEGQAGIVAEYCCHRGASLLLGRVEQCGLRCIYHGWLFSPDGTVLETPNVADPRFKDRIRHKAYAVREAGGLVWAYLGEPGTEPPLPHMPFFDVPEENRFAVRHVNNANFVQVQEALVDSTHLGFLHQSSLARLQAATATDDSLRQGTVMLEDLAPRFETEQTPYGFRYAAIRSVPDAQGDVHDVVRVTPWIAPFTTLNPAGTIATIVVPMSDTQTAFYHLFFSDDQPLSQSPHRDQCISFAGLEPEQLARYGMIPGEAGNIEKPSRANRWLQDRQSMRDGTAFSGYPGIIADDAAMSGSAGPVRSREIEYLSHADLGVTRLYRSLLEIAGSAGTKPRGANIGDGLKGVRGYQATLAPGERWNDGASEVAAPEPSMA